MKLALEIIITFFKVGLFTFGGGYAMIPIVKREVVIQKKWISEEQLLDYYGVAQVSPGIIAINTNALIGYQIKGKTGAILAGLATALPSIIIITFIALIFENFFELAIIAQVFLAIRIAVAALIVQTAFGLSKKGILDTVGLVLFSISLISMFVFNITPIILIVFSALVGILFYPKGKVV